MSKQKIMIGFISIFLMFLSLEASAIQVNVKSTAQPVSALGFTVQGKNYGGLGSSYHNNNVPPGQYSFGIRTDKNIGCTMANGKKMVTLKKNTTALLKYDGRKCRLQISSK